MSKKTFVFFIVVLLLVLGLIGWHFFVRTAAEPSIDFGPSESSDLFPFGERPADNGSGGLVTQPTDDEGNAIVDLGGGAAEIIPQLRQVSAVPTAGAVAYDIGSTTVIRYMERATGHIYETQSDTMASRKLSNVTMPKVYEAIWAEDGGRLLVRYMKDDGSAIRTFYARIATTTAPEKAIEGIFLADGIREVSLRGNKAFYFSETANGAQGILANIDGSAKVSVFNSSFGDWRSSLASPVYAAIFTRPSGTTEGSAYILSTSNGAYAKVVGGLPGLVALANADGSRVLVSAVQNNSLNTFIYDSKGVAGAPIGLSTIADKCVWSGDDRNIVFCAVPRSVPNAVLPDDWYKGKISFNDSVWRIDAVSGETDNLFDPELEAGISMDIIGLRLDQDEEILIFTNKKDMTVWAYRLEE